MKRWESLLCSSNTRFVSLSMRTTLSLWTWHISKASWSSQRPSLLKISWVRKTRRFLIDSWPFMVNLWTEQRSFTSYGTHTNALLTSWISGIGKLMFMKGSKVTEMWLQSTSGHFTVLLNYPCMRSTMIDWQRLRWSSQDSWLAWMSFSPWYSIIVTSGFSLTRLRSSCKLSSKMLRNSCESYYSRFENYFLKREIVCLKLEGTIRGKSLSQSWRTTRAYDVAIFPWVPSGFCKLISSTNKPRKK